jgi:hypothetical protein
MTQWHHDDYPPGEFDERAPWWVWALIVAALAVGIGLGVLQQ